MLDMKRRSFIALLGGAAAACALPAAWAQQPTKVARIGHLDLGPASARASRVEALRAGLRDLGYVEGKNIVIEFRWADEVQQLSELAAELARMNVDVIFAPSSTMVEPARQATKTIPHRVFQPCRSRRHGARGEPPPARQKYHGAVDAPHRSRCQGAGDIGAS